MPGQPAPNWQDIYLFDMATTPPLETRLSIGAASTPRFDNSFATWSPTGHRLFFTSSRGSFPLTALYAMDPTDTNNDMQGDNLATLTAPADDHDGGDWRSGGKVVYTRGVTSSGGDVHIADISAAGDSLSNIQMVASGGDYRSGANWSPAGDAVIYEQSHFVPNTGWVGSIVHLDIAAGAEQPLSPAGQSDATPYYVTPDKIVFARRALTASEKDIFTAKIDLSGSPHLIDVTQLTATTARTEHGPRISPDGKCLGFGAAPVPGPKGPNSDFYIIDLETGEERQITTTRDFSGFAWRP